jgi:cellulose synthase/poly-beta-1,6-N-acetylglucosamine synthase-like glycosyltransferase
VWAGFDWFFFFFPCKKNLINQSNLLSIVEVSGFLQYAVIMINLCCCCFLFFQIIFLKNPLCAPILLYLLYMYFDVIERRELVELCF